MPPDDPAPEFSRAIALGSVGLEGRQQVLEATEPERAALAVRLRIPAVESFRAELRLWPEEDGAVRVEGNLIAEVVQTCVVTLEPVAQRVEEPVALRLLPAGVEPDDDPDEPDEIPSRNGAVDLGEALAEQLALALDPYPKAPDAVLPEGANDADAHPMAALAALRGAASDSRH